MSAVILELGAAGVGGHSDCCPDGPAFWMLPRRPCTLTAAQTAHDNSAAVPCCRAWSRRGTRRRGVPRPLRRPLPRRSARARCTPTRAQPPPVPLQLPESKVPLSRDCFHGGIPLSTAAHLPSRKPCPASGCAAGPAAGGRSRLQHCQLHLTTCTRQKLTLVHCQLHLTTCISHQPTLVHCKHTLLNAMRRADK